MAINPQVQSQNSYLYLSNSFAPNNALKTLIASEGLNSWSRGKIHFCLNDNGTSNALTQNADLKHSRMSIDYSGNVAISGALTINGSTVTPGSNTVSIALLADQKTSGTNGGSYTASNLVTRTLNTIVSDPSSMIVSLASNRFTLSAGSYLIEARVPGSSINNFMAVIKNVTANTFVYGESSQVANSTMSRAVARQQVTIGSNTVFEINMIGSVTNTNGCGTATSLNTETYTTVMITQLA